MKKVLRMFKSFLTRKKKKETKEIIKTLEKRKIAHIKHQKEKIKKYPNKYSENAREQLNKKLKVE